MWGWKGVEVLRPSVSGDRGRSPVGSDCHWQSFTTDPFESPQNKQKYRSIPNGMPLYLARLKGFGLGRGLGQGRL